MRKMLLAIMIALMVQTSITPISPNKASTETFKLTILPGNSMVRLSWDDVPDSKGYLAYRRIGEDGEFELLTKTVIVGTSLLDNGCSNNTTLCYYISALDSLGQEFATSNEECTTAKEQYPNFAKPCNLTMVFQVDNLSYYVNGAQKTMKSPVLVRENRTFLLFRHIIEEIGGNIAWDANDRRVDITYKSKSINLWIGKSKAMVDGKEMDIDPANPRISPFIFKGFTYVPLRFPITSLNEGSVIWHGDTKQITLMFPDRCNETVEGMLEKWSPETNLGIISTWSGSRKRILLEPTKDYMPTIGDCLKVEGRNDNNDDPSLLVVEKVTVIDCPQSSLEVIKGKVLSVNVDKPSFEMETEKGKTLVVSQNGVESLNNLIRRLKAGTCVRAFGKYASQEQFVAEFIETIKCQDNQEQYSCQGKWVSGYVMKSDCANNTVQLKLLSGDLLTGQIPSNANCEYIKRGQCFRACIGENKEINLLFAFDCQNQSCIGENFKGKVISFNKETSILKVSKGDSLVELNIEGIIIPEAEKLSCVEACAILADGKYVALWLRPLTPEECTECATILKGKVIRIDCKNRRATIQNTSLNETIDATFATDDFCQLSVGECYEFCLSKKDGSNILATFKQIECPNPCNGDVVFGLVTFIDCGGQVVKLLADDGEKTYRISRDVCATLPIKSCIMACIEKDAAGNISLVSFTVTDGSNCPVEKPKTCDGELFTAKIISADCKNGKVKVYVIESPYGSGMTMELPVSDNLKSLCSKLVPGKCYKACADTSSIFSPKLVWMEEIPCPEIQPECNKTIKGTISDMDCATNGMLELLSDGTKIRIIIKTAEPCKDFKVGDCVEACVFDAAGAIPVLVKLTKLEPGDCNPKPECKTVLAKVVAVDCTNGFLSLKTSEATFRAKAKEIDICKQIQPGTCIKACLDFATDPYTLVSFEKANDDQCPSECDEMVKINVTSVWCNNKYIEGTEILTVEARSPRKLKITFDNDDFCKMVRQRCYLVCVSKDDKGGFTGNWFKEVSCQTQADCLGRTVETKIAGLDCDNGKIKFVLDGEIVAASIDTERCSTLKPGLCVRLCVSQDEKGELSARVIDILDTDKCQPCSCNGKLTTATVTEVDNQAGVAVIKDINGNQTKVLLTDKSISLNLYDCIRACLVYDQKNKIWLANSVAFLPQEECITCTGNVRKGIITSLDCDNGYLSIRVGNAQFKVKYEQNLCYRLRVGEYVAFCAEWDAAGKLFVAQWIRQIDRKSCTGCTGRKVFGTISQYQPNQLTEMLTENGTVKFFTDKKAFIEMMANGGCFEACLQWNQTNNYFELQSLNFAPDSVCENMKFCKGKKFEGVISSAVCEKGMIKVAIGNNIWNVDTSKTDFACSNDMVGRCVEICGDYAPSTAMPTTIVAQYINLKPDQDCGNSQTSVIRGILKNIDSAKGTAKLEIGRTLVILSFTTDEKLTEGVCYKCIGYYKPNGVFVVLAFVKLEREMCEWSCNGDTVKGQLLEYTNDGMATFVAGAQMQKMKLSDSALEYLQKNSPSSFPMCVRICVKPQTATTALPPMIIDIEILSASECNDVCSGQIIQGTIESLDCKKGVMTITDTLGKKQAITIDSGACQRLKPGICVKICLSTTGKLADGTYEAAWVEQDASSCGQTCQKVVASVYEVNCTNTLTIIKCITKDTRYTLNLPAADCRTYLNAKCISFCLEMIEGKLSGKIVGKVEILPENSCSDIPDPCKGKLIWNATIVRLDCTNGKAYLSLGGKEKYAYISQSLCKELVVGKCYKLCISFANGAYTIDFASPSPNCDLVCFEGKVTQFDSVTRRVLCENKNKERMMISLPPDFTTRLWNGMCIKACGQIENNLLSAQLAEEVKCSSEQLIEFSGTVTEVNCRTRIMVVKTDDGKTYTVKMPDNFDCGSLKQGVCVSVKGTTDENNLVNATYLSIIRCKQGWNLYVFDVFCNTQKPYVLARKEGSFITVHLPAGFNCSSIQPNTCIYVTGELKQSQTAVAVIQYIEATSITTVQCPNASQFNILILTKDCNARYLTVEVNGYTKKLYYPKSFDCNSAEIGTCAYISGVDNGGYIDCFSIKIGECGGFDTWIEGPLVNANCASKTMTIKQNNISYTVFVNSSELCARFKVGQCINVKGKKMSSRSQNIIATNLTPVSCTNRFHGKITRLDCRNEGVYCDVNGKTYAVALVYLRGLCSRLKVGQCIAVDYKDKYDSDKMTTVTATAVTVEPCQ